MQNNPSFKTLVTTKNTIEVARELLGFELIFNGPKGPVGGIITETEAYTEDDPACHAHEGKKTKRNAPMFLSAGHIYIYFIYGMYHCLNIVTEEAGVGAAVLIRKLKTNHWFKYYSKQPSKHKKTNRMAQWSEQANAWFRHSNGTKCNKCFVRQWPLQLNRKEKPSTIQALPELGFQKLKTAYGGFAHTQNLLIQMVCN